MAPKSGKQATKGQKQILEENSSTLSVYSYIIITCCSIYGVLTYLLFWQSFTLYYMVLYGMTVLVLVGCYKFMASMAKPTFSSEGSLQDGGIDLNINHGMAEHTKDLIILTCATQLLSLLSNYFWLLLLAAPCRAGYMLWVNILSPWFFAESPPVDEKKAKKMDRKMKRQQQS